jgi:DNA-binding CsgD family transcriptional regulator
MTDTTDQCHADGCNEPALVGFDDEWFCMDHFSETFYAPHLIQLEQEMAADGAPDGTDPDPECAHCGATDEPEHGIFIAAWGDLNTSMCTICLAEDIHDRTVLSKRESEVIAHARATNAPAETIGGWLDIERSTVNEYRRRIREKIRKSRATASMLGDERWLMTDG